MSETSTTTAAAAATTSSNANKALPTTTTTSKRVTLKMTEKYDTFISEDNNEFDYMNMDTNRAGSMQSQQSRSAAVPLTDEATAEPSSAAAISRI